MLGVMQELDGDSSLPRLDEVAPERQLIVKQASGLFKSESSRGLMTPGSC